MGRLFGKLGFQRGVITYSLSPFEQRAFAGVLSNGLPNVWRRFAGSVVKVAPPLLICYLVFDWGKKEHIRLTRKDPNEFANDV